MIQGIRRTLLDYSPVLVEPTGDLKLHPSDFAKRLLPLNSWGRAFADRTMTAGTGRWIWLMQRVGPATAKRRMRAQRDKPAEGAYSTAYSESTGAIEGFAMRHVLCNVKPVCLFFTSNQFVRPGTWIVHGRRMKRTVDSSAHGG
jgi:hypothetical protein